MILRFLLQTCPTGTGYAVPGWCRFIEQLERSIKTNAAPVGLIFGQNPGSIKDE